MDDLIPKNHLKNLSVRRKRTTEFSCKLGCLGRARIGGTADYKTGTGEEITVIQDL
jgi:hypothetical protein